MDYLQKIGSSKIVFIDQSDREIDYLQENISGESTNVTISREFTTSPDGKNWDIWKPFNKHSLSGIRGKHIRLKYTLERNLLDSKIYIGKPLIIHKPKETSFIDQGESFLLSGVHGMLDYSEMSRRMQKVEIDMNYFIQQHSAIKVKYWHTNPEKTSEDKFLREYSLHNVVDTKILKVVVRDNQIPEPKHEFSQWGIEFEKLEVYFEKTYFEEVFGIGEEPRRMDYLYFSETNRMYYIQDVYLNRGIGENGNFYVCVIKKYEDMSNVEKREEDLDFLQNLNIDDYDDEQFSEMEDITNPKQNLDKIGIDNLTHEEYKADLVDMKQCEYDNNGNSIGKFVYDMSISGKREVAVKYLEEVNTKEGISFMFWIELLDENKHEVWRLQGDKPFSISLSTKEISIKGNGEQRIDVSLKTKKFYCVIIGINNSSGFLRCNIYEVSQNKTTALQEVMEEIIPLKKLTSNIYGREQSVIDFSGKLSLISGAYAIRQIRICKHDVDKVHHSYIMSYSMVKTPSRFFIIDDCVAPLKLDKKSKSLFRELNEKLLERRTLR